MFVKNGQMPKMRFGLRTRGYGLLVMDVCGTEFLDVDMLYVQYLSC